MTQTVPVNATVDVPLALFDQFDNAYQPAPGEMTAAIAAEPGQVPAAATIALDGRLHLSGGGTPGRAVAVVGNDGFTARLDLSLENPRLAKVLFLEGQATYGPADPEPAAG